MDKKLTRSQIRKQMTALRSTLHYWQMIKRMDIRAVKADTDNIRHFAAQMRELQKLENKPKTGDKMSAKKQNI